MDIDPKGPRPRRRVHRRAWQAARAAEIAQIVDDLIAHADVVQAYVDEEPEPEPQVIEAPVIELDSEPRLTEE